MEKEVQAMCIVKKKASKQTDTTNMFAENKKVKKK